MLEELANNAFGRQVLLVILITLLPLIPSYILFKFLPSESIVSGPFKGLQVNFSGATAIYFIIFITIIGISYIWEHNPDEQENYEVWTVKGKLISDNIEDYKEEGFSVTTHSPEAFKMQPNGKFDLYILRERNPKTGMMEFPTLYMQDSDGDYTIEPIDIDLEDSTWGNGSTYNIQQIDSSKTIIIKGPITIDESLPDLDQEEEALVNVPADNN